MMINKELIKLDIGCGKFKKEGYIGIDNDKNSNADIIASALEIPFEDASVDKICSLHLVEHLYPNETKKFFSEIYRLLKKAADAYLKIDMDWTKKRLFKKDPTHVYRYSAKEIKEILSCFNFSQCEVKRKIYFFNFQPRIKIFVRLVK